MNRVNNNVAPLRMDNINIDSQTLGEDIVLFDRPLNILGCNETQWNNTRYDLDSFNEEQWDGVVTLNHSNKVEDVIAKAINLKKKNDKKDRGVFISGLKFALKENPLAVLAKNLLTSGFVTGFSCETMGEEPVVENGELIWKNHVLCGLSLVSHPNSKECYAVISNSIDEAKSYGLDTSKITNEIKQYNVKYDALGRPVRDKLGRKIK